jgi:hypothetical protein
LVALPTLFQAMCFCHVTIDVHHESIFALALDFLFGFCRFRLGTAP